MDPDRIQQRATLTLIAGVAAIGVGAIVIYSQTQQFEPSTAVMWAGWIVSGVGAMFVQASIVGFILGVRDA